MVLLTNLTLTVSDVTSGSVERSKESIRVVNKFKIKIRIRNYIIATFAIAAHFVMAARPATRCTMHGVPGMRSLPKLVPSMNLSRAPYSAAYLPIPRFLKWWYGLKHLKGNILKPYTPQENYQIPVLMIRG